MQKRRRSSAEGSMGTWSQMPIPGMTPWMGYAGHCAGQKRQELSRPVLEGFWAWSRASGIVYTLVETAKLNHLDVFGYLCYLLESLPDLDLSLIHI